MIPDLDEEHLRTIRAEVAAGMPSKAALARWLVAWKRPQIRLDTRYTGKWLTYRSRSQIDQVWQAVAGAVERGELGTLAKVSTTTSNVHAHSRAHVICVYNSDHRDLADMSRVLLSLRHVGIGERLSYKEDAATLAGVLRPGGKPL